MHELEIKHLTTYLKLEFLTTQIRRIWYFSLPFSFTNYAFLL